MMTLSSSIKYQVFKKLLIPSSSVSSLKRDTGLESKKKVSVLLSFFLHPPPPPPSFPACYIAPIIHKTSDIPPLIPPPALARFRIDTELHHLRSIANFFKNEKKEREKKK